MYVCVIGGANIDISSTPYSQLNMADSNPSVITTSLGGVGRNIAENLARLGIDVVFISVLSNDLYGTHLSQHCQQLSIDIQHCLVSNSATSMYMCINDHCGDMHVACSDMSIMSQLTPQYLATKLDIINNASCVVADTNNIQCLQYLQDNVTVPLFVDTVSANKAMLMQGRLNNIFCVKCNTLEACILANMNIDDEQCLHSASRAIHDKGVQWVIITNGSKAVSCMDNRGHYSIDTIPTTVTNTTGAGDSYLAGVVSSYIAGNDITHCAKIGCCMASVTVASRMTVSSDINQDNINKLYKENYDEVSQD